MLCHSVYVRIPIIGSRCFHGDFKVSSISILPIRVTRDKAFTVGSGTNLQTSGGLVICPPRRAEMYSNGHGQQCVNDHNSLLFRFLALARYFGNPLASSPMEGLLLF